MDIKEGLKLKGRPAQIPDCGRNDLAVFFAECGFKVGAEIGVNKGDYTKILCDAGLRMYGVDPYVNYDDYKRPKGYRSYYEEALESLKGYNCRIIKKFSYEAAKRFGNETLDFVYIDGNHTLPYIVQDIFLWERKIKIGGIVSGHDYARIKGHREGPGKVTKWDGCHVKSGVDACADIMKIKKYWVLGERFSKQRDKWRSWFWIKN